MQDAISETTVLVSSRAQANEYLDALETHPFSRLAMLDQLFEEGIELTIIVLGGWFNFRAVDAWTFN